MGSSTKLLSASDLSKDPHLVSNGPRSPTASFLKVMRVAAEGPEWVDAVEKVLDKRCER
jgi:hypothetical protein